MKIKLNSDHELPPSKTIEILRMIIIISGVFFGNNKYCSQVFLDECLYKL